MEINNVRPMPRPGEIYRHYKNKKKYTVIAIATHTETDEKMVVYQNSENQVFVRPLELFIGNVLVEDRQVLRFTKL